MNTVNIEIEKPKTIIAGDTLQSFLDFIKTSYGVSQQKFGRDYCGFSGEHLCNLKKRRVECKQDIKHAIIGGIVKLMEELLFIEEKADAPGFHITKSTTIDEILEFINREPEGGQNLWPI